MFDECGAIIVADDDSILDLIRNHEWKELFWNNKKSFGKNIQCYVFGHAMHEKSLASYIGMTAQTIMLKETSGFFQKNYTEQIEIIDRAVSELWVNKKIENPTNLQPFPLLGVPGWWNKKQDESFYLNHKYFRRKNQIKNDR